MKKTLLFLLFVGLSMFGVLFLVQNFGTHRVMPRTVTPSASQNTFKVSSSFYPLYFFTSQIGKGQLEVTNLTPAGTEPHDYEPNAKDIAQLEKVQLLVVNGAGLEAWLPKVTQNLQAKKVPILVVAEHLSFNSSAHAQVSQDPHFWLDPILAKQEVAGITQELSRIDPAHQTEYQKNAEELSHKLDVLDQDFRTGLANCQQKNIVTSHQAFGYLAARYGLTQLAIAGLSPDQEPSPSELAKLTQFAKLHSIKYIFFESLVSPRLAETLAQEVGAKTLVFDPLEGLSTEDQAAGHDYFSVQRQNLVNLKLALECQ